MFKNPFKVEPTVFEEINPPPSQPTPKEPDIELIVFKNEASVVLAGVQSGRWEKGHLQSKAELVPAGVILSYPKHRDVFVPMANIRQIEFKNVGS